MKTWFKSLILLLLLQLQAFGVYGDHTIVPGIGLLALCVYQALTDNAKAKLFCAALTWKEKIAAALYSIVLVTGISMPWPAGIRYGFLLSLTLLCILAVVIVRQMFKRRTEVNPGPKKATLTDDGIHSASALLVYIISFHLGVQIWFSFAFQLVIVVSCLIIYGLERGTIFGPKTIQSLQARTTGLHKRGMHEFAKYWNAFIGIWCIMIMRDNGFFTEGQEKLIIFTYIILLFLIYIGGTHAFNAREMVWIAFVAAFLTGIDPLVEDIFRVEIPSFIQALLLIVAFDLGGYFFLRRFDPAAPQISNGKRAVAYLAAALFVFCINQVAQDPHFDMDIMMKGQNTAVYSSVLGGSDNSAGTTGNASIEPGGDGITPAEPVSGGKVVVEDPENSFHRAGT